MPEPSGITRPSRGKVWLHLTAGQPVGKPLAEWGYRTPRFPEGIKGSDLINVPPEIRRETTIIWFLANHIPAKGPYFGLDGGGASPPTGPLNFGALNLLALAGSVEIGGFDQAPFFNGGSAIDLLKGEFDNIVEVALLAEVAGLFDGLWEILPPEPIVELENQTPAQRAEAIAAALDEFAVSVRKLVPEYGEIGHNGPPDDTPISYDDREILLKATADARLAVSSSDYSSASLAWKTAKPVLDKIASAVSRYSDIYFTKFFATLGVIGAASVPVILGNLIGIWTKAQAIDLMLEILKHY